MSKRAITVAAMRRILAHPNLDPAALVVLETRDRKGEPVYLPAHSTSVAAYDTKHKDVGLFELSPMAIKLGATEEDVVIGGKAAIVLHT